VLYALAAAALFGTIGTARVLGPTASAWTVGAARLLLAAALLVAIGLRYAGAARVRAAFGRPAIWTAGVAQAAFQVTFLGAVELTGVAVGTLLAIGTAPIWTGLLTRQVSRVWVAATSLAVGGLALLVLAGGADFSASGAALALAAGVAYAVYTTASGAAAAAGTPAPAATAGAFAIAAGCLTPALWLGDLGWLPTAEGLALVAYLALAPTVVAYLLFAAALRTLPAPTVQTLGLAEPVIATALGVTLLDERLTPAGVLGAAAVLLALLIVGRADTSRRDPAADR
jgi:DME family drug/metabolite transporter